MGEVGKYLSTSLQKLEKVQSEIGEGQFQLYEALALELPLASTEEGIRKAVLDMEDVQRIVGMIQVNLIKAMVEHKKAAREAAKPGTPAKPGNSPLPAPKPDMQASLEQDAHAMSNGIEAPASLEASRTQAGGQPPLLPEPSAEQPVLPGHSYGNITEWLRERGLTVTGTREPVAQDKAADDLALFLGDHFENVESLYWMLKRQAMGGSHKRLSLRGKSEEQKGDVRAWGKSLLKQVFLREFRADPWNDSVVASLQASPQITGFFTGQWLERYCAGILKREAASAGLSAIEIAAGVRVRDDVGRDAEFDLLALRPNGQVLWIECKSGQWRDYLSRYRWLNMDHLHLPEAQAALAITEKIDKSQSHNAGAISGMNVLHIQHLQTWIKKALK